MKALLINGSPRNNGSTAKLLNEIKNGLEKNAFESKIICLGDMNIRFCRGCKSCYDTGECLIEDDMNRIIEEIIGADILVVASPSYWGYVTGQMKTFFDRSTPYCDTNPNLKQVLKLKAGVAVAVRTGKTESENTSILEAINHYFGHMGITPIGSLSITGIDSPEDLDDNEELLKKAYELGNSIKF